MKKTLQLRLAESIDLVEKLKGLGIDTKMPAMDDFRRDMNAFVRDGTESTGDICLSEMCTLQYQWKIRGKSVIQSKK
jgi:hypothetical protein